MDNLVSREFGQCSFLYACARAYLPRPPDLAVLLLKGLVPVRKPAGHTRNGKEHGEKVGREAHR